MGLPRATSCGWAADLATARTGRHLLYKVVPGLRCSRCCGSGAWQPSLVGLVRIMHRGRAPTRLRHTFCTHSRRILLTCCHYIIHIYRVECQHGNVTHYMSNFVLLHNLIPCKWHLHVRQCPKYRIHCELSQTQSLECNIMDGLHTTAEF